LRGERVEKRQRRNSQCNNHYHSNQRTANGIDLVLQSSKGKESILYKDKFGNFVDNIDRTSPVNKALIASIVKVRVGDPVLKVD
jgi:S-adenosylmethionine hydrolase